jgi:hypothetical protein
MPSCASSLSVAFSGKVGSERRGKNLLFQRGHHEPGLTAVHCGSGLASCACLYWLGARLGCGSEHTRIRLAGCLAGWKMPPSHADAQSITCTRPANINSPTRCRAIHAGEHRWKLLTTLSGYHDRTIFSVDWSKDGLIATGCADNAIRVFSEAGGEGPQGVRELFLKQAFSMACRREQAHPTDVNCVRWHPTEPGLLASAGDDCTIRIWRYQPPQP